MTRQTSLIILCKIWKTHFYSFLLLVFLWMKTTLFSLKIFLKIHLSLIYLDFFISTYYLKLSILTVEMYCHLLVTILYSCCTDHLQWNSLQSTLPTNTWNQNFLLIIIGIISINFTHFWFLTFCMVVQNQTCFLLPEMTFMSRSITVFLSSK